jgi:hypothetical protein
LEAIVVHKRVTGSLDGFIKADPLSAHFEHCLASPVWFPEGKIDPKNVAVCIVNEDASLRIADHAGHMLAGVAGARITLLHAEKKPSYPISCRPSEAHEK